MKKKVKGKDVKVFAFLFGYVKEKFYL